jgi:DNA-binding response OmpR family regulator
MSEITGVELCRQIRAFDKSTPILMCSGAVTEADREEASLAGAQGYIGKPFNARDLIGALRSCLNRLNYERTPRFKDNCPSRL